MEPKQQNEVDNTGLARKNYNVVNINKADVLKNFVQSTPFNEMKLEKLREILDKLGEDGLDP